MSTTSQAPSRVPAHDGWLPPILDPHVLTGTPLGSGMAVNPPQRLTPGQTMVLEVEGLGTLTTPTEAEQ